MLVEPPEALTVVPLTLAVFALCCPKNSEAVLLTSLPTSSVLSTIGPTENAVAFLTVLKVLTFVAPGVRPFKLTRPMHLIILPAANVLPLIMPDILTEAVELVVTKLALVL